ncbi:MAG: quinone oxidoreductase [Nitriliruptoraceae bacterium]
MCTGPEGPTPGEGEVLIGVAVVGVNFVDIYGRRGQNPKELPFTVGQEAAGIVEAVGPDVTGFAVGDRVATPAARGAYADKAIAPAGRTVELPDDIPFDVAAATVVQGLTAHYLATSTVSLTSDHEALVHAGAGGVGLLLTQIAKMRGATVYTTVSTREKAELSAAAGADEVILYTEVDFAEEVLRFDPEGVHVVYDSVGRDTFDRGLECLRPLGVMALYGESSGLIDPVDPKRLNAGGSLFLTRPSGKHYMRTPEQFRARAREMFDWIVAGDLVVRIGERHPLAEAATAQQRVESRLTTGKVLLTV